MGDPETGQEKKIGRFLADSNEIGCLVVDDSFQIIFANSFSTSYFGLNDKLPVALKTLFNPEHYKTAEAHLNTFRDSGTREPTEWIISTDSGEMIAFKTEIHWLYKSNSLEFVVLMYPVEEGTLSTDQSENGRLHETLNRMSMAVKTAKLGVWRRDIQSGEKLWNDEMLKMYDIGRDQFEADQSIYEKMLHPEDKDRVIRQIEKIAEGEEVEWTEFRLIRPSGEVRYVRSAGAPILGKDGEVTALTGVNMDITDTKLTENKLLDKSQQLQNITNKIPGVVLRYVLHPDGTDEIKYISKGVETIYGISRMEAMDNPGLIWARILKEDLAEMVASVRKSAGNLEPWNHIFRARDKQGNIVHLNGMGTPERLGDGSVQWDTLTLNITEQVEKDRFIRKKQEELNRLTNQVPGIVYVYRLHPDGSDSFGYVSEGVGKMFDLPLEKAQNDISLIWEAIHEEDVEKMRDSIALSAKNMTEWNCEYRIRTANEEIKYIKGSGSPVKLEGGTIEWYSIGIDITSRVKAEREALENNSKLRALINSSPVAIYLLNEEGTVKDFWNPAAERIYGWSKEEVIGKSLPHVQADDWEEYYHIVSEIKESRVAKQRTVSRRHADGSELILDITVGPIFDHEGNLTDMLVISNDITELVNYRKSLEDSLKEKEILLMEIHHRVKNNLAIITGLFDLQIMRRKDMQANSILQDARSRVHSIAIVHEQLYQEMRLSYVNLKEYFEQLFKRLLDNQTSTEVDSRLDINIEKETLNIHKAIPFGLLLTELFMNSIKYAIVDNRLHVQLQIIENKGNVKVMYQDDGPGFDQAVVKEKKSLGWELIHTLIDQLEATSHIDSKGGFRLDLEFSEEE